MSVILLYTTAGQRHSESRPPPRRIRSESESDSDFGSNPNDFQNL